MTYGVCLTELCGKRDNDVTLLCVAVSTEKSVISCQLFPEASML